MVKKAELKTETVAQDRKLRRMVIHRVMDHVATLTPESRTHGEQSGRIVVIVLYLS